MVNTINTYGPTTLFLYFHTSQLTISIVVKFIVKKLFTLLYGNYISGSQIIHTKNYLMSFYSTKTQKNPVSFFSSPLSLDSFTV